MSSESRTVLIIDDEESVRRLVATFLSKRGFQPVQASDGTRGLELFRAAPPSLILLDLCLPDLSGLEVLARLRATGKEVPVVVVSGTGELKDAIEALRRGAWDFVSKPVDLPILEHAILKAFERARLLEENRCHRQYLEEEVRRRTAALDRELRARQAAEEALRHSLGKLQSTLQSFILAMNRVVETRDPYTAGHQGRVARIATSIARQLGCRREQLHAIRWAALIHDIGKIYIPSEILNKPGRLSEIERQMIRTHARVGGEILQPIEFPGPVAEIVYQHHERLDGSGYPRGLAGDEILLEARILLVADVVEAMAAHRPYRPSLGLERALGEIERGSGKIYDEKVSEACLRLLGKGTLRPALAGRQ